LSRIDGDAAAEAGAARVSGSSGLPRTGSSIAFHFTTVTCEMPLI
jgi:hypothetical protein